MTEAELNAKLEGLNIEDEEQKRDVVCALIGHSKIQTTSFFYVHCARCDAQVGDTLGGAYDLSKSVIVGHKCETCEANYKTCTWQDKFMCPDPFE